MSVSQICNRQVWIIEKNASLYEAAKLMKNHNVGSLVVIESNEMAHPVGIITDRMLTLKAIAEKLDFEHLPVQEIMSKEIFYEKESQSILDVLESMAEKGIRRMPIINGENKLIGIVTLDDMISFLSTQFELLARIIQKQTPEHLNL